MAYKVIVSGGSHPRLEDYECSACGHVELDVFYDKKADVKSTIACLQCDKTASRVLIGRRQNHLRLSHSGLYGKFEPGLGVVVKDYAHKQRLMREMGVMEGADPVGGSRCHIVDDPGPRFRHPDTTWVD